MDTEFTPWLSLLGGGLIGAAAVLLMALQGRVAGATGILAGVVFDRAAGENGWRVAFLAGMICGPILLWLLTGAPVAVQVPVPAAALVLGGLLVGIGVTFGNGCTSGHGVCGMARLSVRSIAATLTFMATTAATVFVIRHVFGG